MILSRLRTLVRSIRRRLRSVATRSDAASQPTPKPTAEYRCSICRTPVVDQSDGCPLCGSSDIVSADTPRARSKTDLDPSKTARASIPDDAAADRLTALRKGDLDLLSIYRSDWEEIDSGRSSDGYRVTLADGGSIQVTSRDEVRTILVREYGIPAEPDDDTDQSAGIR